MFRHHRMKKTETHRLCRRFKPFFDLIITLLLWLYFTFGFVVFFFPFYLTAYLVLRNCETAFQRLNHRFFKGFFFLIRLLIPGHKWRIPDEINSIRSSIIICNHISYLDSIFLISLFEKQKTIVKSTFFSVPVLSRLLKLSGYLPSASDGELAELLIQQIENLDNFLSSGGNLFIFPEGTRSRNGTISRFNKGAFKIARRFKAPINVLYIRNTDRLFQPGKFLFNTSVSNSITLEHLACIEPDYQSNDFTIPNLMSEVYALFNAQIERGRVKSDPASL